MKIGKDIAELIGRLEYEIGSQCYNPKSYNGQTGEKGCSFRYPVTYIVKTGDKYEKYKEIDCLDISSEEDVETIRYVFGSNHLYIGAGLANVLQILENRYDINFNELETSYQRKLKMSNEIVRYISEDESEPPIFILKKYKKTNSKTYVWRYDYFVREYESYDEEDLEWLGKVLSERKISCDEYEKICETHWDNGVWYE